MAVLRIVAVTAYVAGVGTLAFVGEVREQAPYLLTAVVLTLPCGIAGLMAVYGGYAFLGAAGRAAGLRRRLPGGDDPEWLTAGSHAVGVAALVLAACGNVVLLRTLLRRRRAQRRPGAGPGRPRR